MWFSKENQEKKTQSEASVKGEDLVKFVHSYTRLRVFANPFFEEVCFSLEADCFHPLERVVNVVVFLVSEGNQESVCTKLDVVAHHGQIHADEFNGEGISDKFHFYVDCAVDNLDVVCFVEAVE